MCLWPICLWPIFLWPYARETRAHGGNRRCGTVGRRDTRGRHLGRKTLGSGKSMRTWRSARHSPQYQGDRAALVRGIRVSDRTGDWQGWTARPKAELSSGSRRRAQTATTVFPRFSHRMQALVVNGLELSPQLLFLFVAGERVHCKRTTMRAARPRSRWRGRRFRKIVEKNSPRTRCWSVRGALLGSIRKLSEADTGG